MTVAFLTATAAQTAGKQVIMFLTKEAVRLGLPGYADAIWEWIGDGDATVFSY